MSYTIFETESVQVPKTNLVDMLRFRRSALESARLTYEEFVSKGLSDRASEQWGIVRVLENECAQIQKEIEEDKNG